MLFNIDELIEKSKNQRQRNRYEEALISSISATELDPDSAEAWWQVALNQLSLGNERNALLAIERTVELAPHFAFGWAKYGNVLLETGDADSARKAFESALEEDPDQEDALKALADIYLRQNKNSQETVERELSILTRLDDVSGLSSFQLHRMGLLHYQSENFFEAIKYWERGALLSDEPSYLYNLGLVYNNPEISQDADAIDLWRLTAKRYPDFLKAQERINNVLPRLLALAKNATEQNLTLLTKDQWYGFYLNPFELIQADIFNEFEDFEAKEIQLHKKEILQEIELEDGCISWMPGAHLDKSKAISLFEELNDKRKGQFHWYVFQDTPLLDFLSRGSHTHFLVDETASPLETIELLEDQDNGFREWLSEPFAKQFDRLLSKAIDQKNLPVLECMLDGRRWVTPPYEDKCFENARRQMDRLLSPMREALECADEVMPTVESVTRLIEQGALVDILNLLPAYFRDLQNEAPSIIRQLAIICYNKHSNIDLSKSILQIARRFIFKSVELNHRLDDDFKQVDEIIRKQQEYREKANREERKHEVHLTSGEEKWEITKGGVRKGTLYFPVNTLSSARWGTIVFRESTEKKYDYLFAVKDNNGAEISFSWKASTDIEKNQGYFSNFVDAAINYLLPSILEKIDNQLNKGLSIQIGPCMVSERGIQFETKGWVFSNTQSIPWQRVRLDVENGELVVSDATSPKKSIAMSLRLIDNAPILHFLAHFRNSIED